MAKKSNEEIAKGAFEAHTTVNELYVTEDGHFYLHPHAGGTKFTKNEDGKIESEAPKADKKKK